MLTEPEVVLTGAQVVVRNALLAALLNASGPIVLQGFRGLGKSTVLTAALASVSDPSLRLIHLDDAGQGMDEAYQTLFGKPQHGPPPRRIVLIADQAEAMSSGTLAYLELLTRMPGKAAPVQLLVVGRVPNGNQIDAPAASRLQRELPVHLIMPPLSELDAWEMFHHRVSATLPQRSVRRLVMSLLEQSGGLPGRFDEILQAAVATGLLEGVACHAA